MTPKFYKEAIETRRLRLRRWKSSDSVPFYSLNSDLSVMEFMTKILSMEESDGMIQAIERGFELHGFGLWALELKEGNTFIGFTGLAIPRFESHFTPCVEVGWRLAKEFWGKGFATEAAFAALEFGFQSAGINEIVSFTAEINLKSIAVMRRLGMGHNPDDDFDHPRLPEGHVLRRHVLYRLKQQDFASGQNA